MNNPQNYSQDAIDGQLRFAKGSRKVSFRYELLNKHDIWIGDLDGITQGTISYGEFRVIKRSATFKLDEHLQKEINFLTDQIRPWLILHMPQGGTVEWPLGIFMSDSPSREAKGNIHTRDIGMCDKTLIIEQDKFTRRFHIEAGTNYVTAITRILNTAGITKINIAETGHTLLTDREYKVGKKKHLACNELLSEINFNSLWVDVNGIMRSEPYVRPSNREITHFYDAAKDSIAILPITEKLDIANRPNVFTRIAINLEQDKELVSTLVNDRPESVISTVNRGRRIVDFYEIDEVASQEALDALVERIAIESTSAFTQFTFGTALMPTHGNADTLWCNFPDLRRDPFKCHETGWEMPLKSDGLMKHEARMVVQL